LAGAAHTSPHFSGLSSSTPSLNIGGVSTASGGPSLDSVPRCPTCGIPLPGGAGTTCPSCGLQQV
jgi:rubrerythrin